MELEIKKLDHNGRGISYLNDKIIFIENALPNEIVDIEITKETSKYYTGKAIKYIKSSPKRTKSKCPISDKCGGCHLRHLSYDDTINFKKNKLAEILEKYAGIKENITVIKNKQKNFYRNKIEVQIVDGIAGFYKINSHDIVETDRCINAEESINDIIRSIERLNVKNGYVTIRSNYNKEIIINIESNEEPNIDTDLISKSCKLVGIIHNDKILYGADHFIEIIDNTFFKVTYNSFFQVNRSICEELFKIVKANIDENSIVLDMCSGVGTLSIIASKKAKKVYGIEIVENSVKDALVNAQMNKCTNIHFMLGDAFNLINKIEEKIDIIIIDPPRSGLQKSAIDTILNSETKKIIYVSCDPLTLGRDINFLKEKYCVKKIFLLDMFSYTYHVECVCVLNRR